MIIPGEKVMVVFEEVDVEVDGAAEESRQVGHLSDVVDYQRKVSVYLQDKYICNCNSNVSK